MNYRLEDIQKVFTPSICKNSQTMYEHSEKSPIDSAANRTSHAANATHGFIDTIAKNSTNNIGLAAGIGAGVGGLIGYSTARDKKDRVRNTTKGAVIGAGVGAVGNAIWQNSDAVSNALFTEEDVSNSIGYMLDEAFQNRIDEGESWLAKKWKKVLSGFQKKRLNSKEKVQEFVADNQQKLAKKIEDVEDKDDRNFLLEVWAGICDGVTTSTTFLIQNFSTIVFVILALIAAVFIKNWKSGFDEMMKQIKTRMEDLKKDNAMNAKQASKLKSDSKLLSDTNKDLIDSSTVLTDDQKRIVKQFIDKGIDDVAYDLSRGNRGRSEAERFISSGFEKTKFGKTVPIVRIENDAVFNDPVLRAAHLDGSPGGIPFDGSAGFARANKFASKRMLLTWVKNVVKGGDKAEIADMLNRISAYKDMYAKAREAATKKYMEAGGNPNSLTTAGVIQ